MRMILYGVGLDRLVTKTIHVVPRKNHSIPGKKQKLANCLVNFCYWRQEGVEVAVSERTKWGVVLIRFVVVNPDTEYEGENHSSSKSVYGVYSGHRSDNQPYGYKKGRYRQIRDLVGV